MLAIFYINCIKAFMKLLKPLLPKRVVYLSVIIMVYFDENTTWNVTWVISHMFMKEVFVTEYIVLWKKPQMILIPMLMLDN